MTIREPAVDIWSAAIDEFPLGGNAADKLTALVPFAILAPSSHNSQPWRFRIVGDALELRMDPDRRLPIVDPVNRELIISCGAALGCLEIALHNFGYQGDITLSPDRWEPELLARIRLGADRSPDDLDHRLFAALRIRRTHRLPFEPRVIDADLQAAFETIAESYGTWFRIVQSETSRDTLVELVTEADREQMSNAEFRTELTAWLRPNGSGTLDGMPGWAFGLGAAASRAFPLIVRTFDTGSGRAAQDRELASGSPVLAILGTTTETVEDWIQTGRALAHILVRAAVEGVAASYLNQPIEVTRLRHKVVALLGHSGYPHLILRMGYPRGEGRRTPRRKVTEVLEGR